MKKKSSSKKKRKKKKKSESDQPTSNSSNAEAIESAPKSKKSVHSNSAAFADELYNLTGELQASNRELARATKYFYEEII